MMKPQTTFNTYSDYEEIPIPTELLEGTPDYYRVPLPYTDQFIPLILLCHSLRPNLSEAVRHIFRAGRKHGESYIEALRSALISLQLELTIEEFYRNHVDCNDYNLSEDNLNFTTSHKTEEIA